MGLLRVGSRNQLTSIPRAIYLLRGRYVVLPRALPQPSDVWRWIRNFLEDATFSANTTVSALLCFQEHDWPLQAPRHVSAQSSFSRFQCLPCSAGQKKIQPQLSSSQPCLAIIGCCACSLIKTDPWPWMMLSVLVKVLLEKMSSRPSGSLPSSGCPPLGHGLTGWILPGCRGKKLLITQVLSAQTSY